MVALGAAPVERFVQALGRRDFSALEGALSPAVRFRAVSPDGVVEADDAPTARHLVQRWFSEVDELELVDVRVERVADALHASYRLHLCDETGWCVCIGELIATTGVCGIERLDLLSSGPRPLG